MRQKCPFIEVCFYIYTVFKKHIYIDNKKDSKIKSLGDAA